MASRLEKLNNTESIQAEIYDKTEEYNNLTQQLRQLIDQNSVLTQNQEEYNTNFERLNSQRLILEDEIRDLECRLNTACSEREQINLFFKKLEKENMIIQRFDEDLWNTFVISMTIMSNGAFSLLFKDGTKIDVKL